MIKQFIKQQALEMLVVLGVAIGSVAILSGCLGAAVWFNLL